MTGGSALQPREHTQCETALDVLHVAFTWFPDAVGGTEIYVSGLIEALKSSGLSGAVAAPGDSDIDYQHSGVSVFRFAGSVQSGLAQAYGAPDDIAARSFRSILARVRPRIVHFHAHTAAVSYSAVTAAREAGARMLFTYHTPTASCARGTMMRLGQWPCDGVLDIQRCSDCVLQGHGIPALLRSPLASMPQAVGQGLARLRVAGGAFTALRMTDLIAARQRRFMALVTDVDCVVAVCQWVANVLRANGITEERLVLCRQGLTHHGVFPSPRAAHGVADGSETGGPLRLAYFGRLDPTKGPDLLVQALRRMPAAPVQLDIFGVRQPGSETYWASLVQARCDDPRIVMRPALEPEGVVDAMRQYDFVAVPSRWLETGPLVVLEAFAAGTPILGSRLGGIAEIVSDDVDGLLVAPDDPAAWAEAIRGLSADPERVARLRAGVKAPRTMEDVAREMTDVYRRLLGDDVRRDSSAAAP